MVNARIDRLVGGERSVSPQTFVATATVTRDEAGLAWLVEIQTKSHDASGQRVFRGESCDTVADAAALFVALMLAPALTATVPPAEDAIVRRPPPSPPAARKQNKPAAAEAPPKRQSVAEQVQVKPVPQDFPQAPSPPAPRRWRAGMDITAASGALPDLTARFNAGVGATMLRRLPRVSLELAVYGTRSQSAYPFADAPWVRVEAQEIGAHLAVCFDQVFTTRLFGRACATAGAQRLSLSSDVVATPGHNETMLGTAGVRFAVGYNVTRHVSLVFSNRIDNRLGQIAVFQVPPHGAAWTTPAFIVDLGMGLELNF